MRAIPADRGERHDPVFVRAAAAWSVARSSHASSRRGDDVVALARSDEAAAKLEAKGARTVRGDILDEAAMTEGMRGSDLALPRRRDQHVLPDRPRGAVPRQRARRRDRRARREGRGRAPDRAHVIRRPPSARKRGTVGTEKSPHRGSYMSVYERSKHEGEVAAFAAAKNAGIELVAVLPSSVQGPGRAGGTGPDPDRLPQRQAEGVRRHPDQPRRHRRHDRGPRARRRARQAGRALPDQRRDDHVAGGAGHRQRDRRRAPTTSGSSPPPSRARSAPPSRPGSACAAKSHPCAAR